MFVAAPPPPRCHPVALLWMQTKTSCNRRPLPALHHAQSVDLFATIVPPREAVSRRVLITVDMAVTVSLQLLSVVKCVCVCYDADDTPLDTCGNNDGAAGVLIDTLARQSLPSHLALRLVPKKRLRAGTIRWQVCGEVMDKNVKDQRYLPPMAGQRTYEDRRWAESRWERGQMLTGCYLYGVPLPPSVGSTACTRRVYVDAKDEYKSLWMRFVNHPPPPCNNVNPKSIHKSYNGMPRMWFVAKRDTKLGDEICFNYGDNIWLEGDDVVRTKEGTTKGCGQHAVR